MAQTCKACDRVTHAVTVQGFCYACDDNIREAMDEMHTELDVDAPVDEMFDPLNDDTVEYDITCDPLITWDDEHVVMVYVPEEGGEG